MNEKDVARQKDVFGSFVPAALYVDIETSYGVGTYWGNKMWQVDILDELQPPMPIMVGYMWHGDKKARSIQLPDYKGYKPGLFNINDKQLIEETWDLIDRATVVIGQNSMSFDTRMLTSRFWHYGMPMPRGFERQEDTKRSAKKVFYLSSYKLKYMAKYRGLKQKTDPGGIRAWDEVIREGKGWDVMGKYCRNDVEVTRDLWVSMLPYIKQKTVANLFTRKPYHCPSVTCMSRNYQKAGQRPTKTGSKQRFRCLDCGAGWLGELEKDESKLNITFA